MENNTTSLIAKLLANENISVVHARVSTASFDIKSRVLTLPQWKETTPEITGMLVAHEVGHALWTTDEYYTHDEIKKPIFQGYLNVLEDVRIEKLMKRRYPGIRKTFNQGYQQLNEKDFFEVKTKDLTDLLLIDRINLYFKAGFACGVTFTKEEKVFVDRAEKTETIQEVIDLAKEIYEFTKEDLEKKLEDAKQAQQDDGDEDDEAQMMDMDDDGDEFENEDDFTMSSMPEEVENYEEKPIDDLMESKTEKSMAKAVEELADTSVEYRYFELGQFLYNPIVGYKQILQEFAEFHRSYPEFNMNKEETDKFKSASMSTVNYLVKEFEMKKAATLYKRASVAKVGQLDTRKLASYQLKDDIFKRVTTVPNCKNHGMIFLLDWSGSMSGCIKETIEQVIQLVLFCQRSQIKFQVFAFSDGYKNADREAKRAILNAVTENNPESQVNVNRGNLSLLELFSDKMSTSDLNRMVDIITSRNISWFLRLNSTPLNQALAYMYEYIPAYKKANNVEKLTFITLTDGEGASLGAGRTGYGISDTSYIEGQRVTVKNFIKDANTKKSYAFGHDSYIQTNTMISMIKDAHNVTVLGFYLTTPSWRNIQSAMSAHFGWEQSRDAGAAIERVRKQMREDGFATLSGTGRDEMFLVPLSSTRIKEGEIDADLSAKTASQIARQFGKMLNTRKTSRILLNKFIDFVA